MRWTEIREELLARPGFREALEREFPFRDLSLQVGSLRADLDLTQAEFGELVGMPQSTVARLESGRQNPSVKMLKRIASATGTELVIEFRRPGRKHRARRTTAAASSERETQASKPLAASTADD